jgi:hypothetical protein
MNHTREQVEALLESRRKNGLLNLSESLVIAAAIHRVSIDGFYLPESPTKPIETRTVTLQPSAPLAGDSGEWIEEPPPVELPEQIPVTQTPRGENLELALEWLQDAAVLAGCLKTYVRGTPGFRTEFKAEIQPGTPLAQRAQGRSWEELMEACTNSDHIRAVARLIQSAPTP